VSKVKIVINMENAAFEDKPAFEVARILRALAQRIDDAESLEGHVVLDTNGNRVGAVTRTK
jgi:hypothetical protein